jgi:Cysteine rich repeat
MTSIRVYLGAAMLATITTSAFAGDANVDDLQRRAAFHAAFGACLSDRAKLCPDVVAGQGRIVACLTAHSDQLSPLCANGMANVGDTLIAIGQAMRPAAPAKTAPN